MLETREFATPAGLAAHLAKYVTCPSTIVAGTINHFGRDRGVSLELAVRLVQQERKARRPAADEVEQVGEEKELTDWRDAMRAGSQKLGKVVRLQLGKDWPCGHQRTPETTQTVAGASRCKVCRRSRWNAGFQKIVRKRMSALERKRALIERLRNANRQQSINREQKLKEITEEYSGKLPVRELLFCVACSFGVTVPDLLGPSRSRLYTHPRAVIVKILHERGYSMKHAGRILGGRDHSTAINAVKNWDRYVARDHRLGIAYKAYGVRSDAG